LILNSGINREKYNNMLFSMGITDTSNNEFKLEAGNERLKEFIQTSKVGIKRTNGFTFIEISGIMSIQDFAHIFNIGLNKIENFKFIIEVVIRLPVRTTKLLAELNLIDSIEAEFNLSDYMEAEVNLVDSIEAEFNLSDYLKASKELILHLQSKWGE
ncbi:MAG: hypothetical protein ACOCRO_05355, partial [Halanaerobiales bacterium]